MNQKKQRDPERIIKLYDWLWRRANKGKYAPFLKFKPRTLTGRCIMLLALPRTRIHVAMKSQAYRDAVSKIIYSN